MLYRKWDFNSITYKFNNVTVSGSGVIEVTNKGEVTIDVNISGFIGLPNGHINLTGTSIGGIAFNARGMISNTNVDITSSGTVTTIQIKPLEVTVMENGYQENISVDEVAWHLKNAKLLTSPHSDQIGNFLVTLESISRPKNQKQIAGEISTILRSKKINVVSDDIDQFQDDLSRILTLAQRCPTTPVVKEYYFSGKLVYTKIIEPTGNYIALRPLVTWYADITLNFLKSIYPMFIHQKDPYGLITLIEYYWRSHVESTVEIKFLYGSIFMEALKFNWAANVATNLDTDIKANGLVRGFRPKGAPVNAQNLSFENLLMQTARHLGYPCGTGTFTFIEDRNCIFHSGLSSAPQQGHPSSWPVIKPELERLYNQMDDLILRILGYSGIIFEIDLTTGGRDVNFPARTPAP